MMMMWRSKEQSLGNMELDKGIQPPHVQNKINMDITKSDDDRAVAAKAKRSSLLTMEIERAYVLLLLEVCDH